MGNLSTLYSASPHPLLRPFVRAYAQRQHGTNDPTSIAAVPAQLEQVLNFELGTRPGIRHKTFSVSSPVWIGGAQPSFPGYIDIFPGVESFAIFFQPFGY